MKHYTFAVFLCSLGVDSVTAILDFLDYYRDYRFDYGVLIVNWTPLSHDNLEDYAFLLKRRLIEKYGIKLRLIITDPDKLEVEKPPYCRWVWKQNPTRRVINQYKGAIVITGQRKKESIVRSKLGVEGELYGRKVIRPVYNKSKEYCFMRATELLPELKEVWRKQFIETKHTSLDCMTCLRRL